MLEINFLRLKMSFMGLKIQFKGLLGLILITLLTKKPSDQKLSKLNQIRTEIVYFLALNRFI